MNFDLILPLLYLLQKISALHLHMLVSRSAAARGDPNVTRRLLFHLLLPKVGECATPFPGQLRPLTPACWY